jgi:hypothetical protein
MKLFVLLSKKPELDRAASLDASGSSYPIDLKCSYSFLRVLCLIIITKYSLQTNRQAGTIEGGAPC